MPQVNQSTTVMIPNLGSLAISQGGVLKSLYNRSAPVSNVKAFL
jgi:hypothetical protein